MAPVEFVRLQLEAGVGALYALDPQPSGAWVGCFLPVAVEPQPPESLSLEAAWAGKQLGIADPQGRRRLLRRARAAAARKRRRADRQGDRRDRRRGTPYRYLLWLAPSSSGAALESVGAIPFAQSAPESANGSVTGEVAAIHLRTLELRGDTGMTV